MAGPWLPATLPGLHVDLGDYHHYRRVWLRLPVATFTCRHGCHHTAVGAYDVAAFTADITATHAERCPGPTTP